MISTAQFFKVTDYSVGSLVHAILNDVKDDDVKEDNGPEAFAFDFFDTTRINQDGISWRWPKTNDIWILRGTKGWGQSIQAVRLLSSEDVISDE